MHQPHTEARRPAGHSPTRAASSLSASSPASVKNRKGAFSTSADDRSLGAITDAPARMTPGGGILGGHKALARNNTAAAQPTGGRVAKPEIGKNTSAVLCPVRALISRRAFSQVASSMMDGAEYVTTSESGPGREIFNFPLSPLRRKRKLPR